nr:hypothetical protein [Janthinobacterium sp.]
MKQQARKCPVPADAKVFASLPGHHYADAFQLVLPAADRRGMEQLLAARGSGHPERWLARLRDSLVAPFGLKPIGKPAMAAFDRHHPGPGAQRLGLGLPGRDPALSFPHRAAPARTHRSAAFCDVPGRTGLRAPDAGNSIGMHSAKRI